MSNFLGGQALVIGAGMSGLAAAGALANHFEQVTVLERDGLAHDPSHRPGTPPIPPTAWTTVGWPEGFARFFLAWSCPAWWCSSKVARPLAVAVNTDGRREIIGLEVGPSEAETFWSGCLKSLARRGLKNVELVVSDAQHRQRRCSVCAAAGAKGTRGTASSRRSPACSVLRGNAAASPRRSDDRRPCGHGSTALLSMDAQCARPRAEEPAHHARRGPTPGLPAARPDTACRLASGRRPAPAPPAQARRAPALAGVPAGPD